MQSIDQLVQMMKIREGLLTPSLKSLQQELESEYDKQKHAGGVVVPGHFSYLSNILERARMRRVISEFMLTQEEYVNDGNLISIPVVDVRVNSNNFRIFIISKEYVRDIIIDNIIDEDKK